MSEGTILNSMREGVLTLTFMHPKPQNPLGDHMQNLLVESLAEAEADDSVKAVIITGGRDRSFSVGGNFSEIVGMNTSYDKVSGLLGKIMDVYIKVLEVSKPLISAVDHYSIGMGFQIAVLGDYRIATDRAKYKMPEVQNGVACSLGGVILERLINRHEMMRICYECDVLPIEYCKNVGLVNEVVPPEMLWDRAFEKALQYGSYSSVSFRNTKKVNNGRMIKAIKDNYEDVIMSHYLTLTKNVHKPYMKSILKIQE